MVLQIHGISFWWAYGLSKTSKKISNPNFFLTVVLVFFFKNVNQPDTVALKQPMVWVWGGANCPADQ